MWSHTHTHTHTQDTILRGRAADPSGFKLIHYFLKIFKDFVPMVVGASGVLCGRG